MFYVCYLARSEILTLLLNTADAAKLIGISFASVPAMLHMHKIRHAGTFLQTFRCRVASENVGIDMLTVQRAVKHRPESRQKSSL